LFRQLFHRAPPDRFSLDGCQPEVVADLWAARRGRFCERLASAPNTGPYFRRGDDPRSGYLLFVCALSSGFERPLAASRPQNSQTVEVNPLKSKWTK